VRYIAFVVLCSFAAAATPVEVDPATKVQKRAPYWAARGWKELPLPPLTAREKEVYEKYVELLQAVCPVVYARGYVRAALVGAINAVYWRDQGGVLNGKQEKAVLATGTDRDHFIAHCEHLAKGELEDCQQRVVHKSRGYTSVTACIEERYGDGEAAAERYVFQHCGSHSVDPATNAMKLEGLACMTTLMTVMNRKVGEKWGKDEWMLRLETPLWRR
jgi:hypothetical protein